MRVKEAIELLSYSTPYVLLKEKKLKTKKWHSACWLGFYCLAVAIYFH